MPALSLGLRMLCEQAQRTPPGQWVPVVGGWTGAQFAEKRLPAASDLNAAAPDTPVLVCLSVWYCSGSSVVIRMVNCS